MYVVLVMCEFVISIRLQLFMILSSTNKLISFSYGLKSNIFYIYSIEKENRQNQNGCNTFFN